MVSFSIASLIAPLALFFAAQASPLDGRNALDVYVPTIITPDAATVWTVGQDATVTWDSSDAPKSISNGALVVLSAYGTLAKDFDLRAGNVTVLVPADVTPGTHRITLFGDSGNYSPYFSIVQSN